MNLQRRIPLKLLNFPASFSSAYTLFPAPFSLTVVAGEDLAVSYPAVLSFSISVISTFKTNLLALVRFFT